MQIILDRLEGEYWIAEMPSGKTVNIPEILIPDAKEGDCVEIAVNKSKTAELKKEISDLMDSVWED